MNWFRRIRGAVGMGVTWAIGWALFGILIGVTSKILPGLPWDSFFDVFDAPLPALAVPGFFAGMFFFLSLLMAWSVGEPGARSNRSIMDTVPAAPAAPAPAGGPTGPAPTAPAAPSAPSAPTR